MTKFLLIAAAAVAALSTQAAAQQPAHEHAAPQGDLKGNWLQADQTRQQAQQRADRMFQQLDSNRDGVLTRQEAEQASAQTGKRGGKRAARMAERLFSQSASVTQAQFQALALARFDRQDLNRDGIVTGGERQQLRAQRGQRAN